MKKHAICIQCHTKPEIINFLIEYMPEQYFDFYIHVDMKSDIFDKIEQRKNVYFSERVNVKWGCFSQVEATLSMFKMIESDKYSYIHLISGSDFIVKRPEEIIEFFSRTDMEYIESNPLDNTCTWSWHGVDRYECYYPQWMIDRPAKKILRVIRVLYREFIMRTKIFKRKNFPVNVFYGGSSWFSITGKSLEWMLNYLKNHPDYIQHFKHGVCVDEVFFSTLMRYSPYKNKIFNNNLRYMKWKGENSGGPKILSQDDFQDMISSNCFWARKFNDLRTVEKLCIELSGGGQKVGSNKATGGSACTHMSNE